MGAALGPHWAQGNALVGGLGGQSPPPPFKGSIVLCKHSGDPWRYFYFHFAEVNVSIMDKWYAFFYPVHLTISSKFNFYAPN